MVFPFVAAIGALLQMQEEQDKKKKSAEQMQKDALTESLNTANESAQLQQSALPEDTGLIDYLDDDEEETEEEKKRKQLMGGY